MSDTFLPIVVRGEYRGEHRIRVTFSDRSAKTIDFTRWLKGPIFRPLKDTAYFRRFTVSGGTVSWPNGTDIAPETLYAADDEKPAMRAGSGRSRGDGRKKRSTRHK